MPVSLRDVAAAAGVSIKTVSNVVNGYPFISEQTKARVQAALDELGYRPNLSARRLRSGRSGLIALAVPELTPYFADLAEQVVVAAEKRGLTVLIDRTGGDRPHERRVAAGIRDNVTDGVIASPLALTAEDVEEIRGTHPIVLLGERLWKAGADHVAVDDVAAAAAAVGHLAQLGRTRIAAIGTTDRPAGTAAHRLEGYRKGLTAAGLPLDRTLLGDVERYHREDGRVAMTRLLETRPDLDAVFCFNDLLALGALAALREARQRVPEDVAVAGFDDIEECRYCDPPLTSIAPDTPALAGQAVELLVQRINKTAPEQPRELFPSFELMVRASSAGRQALPSASAPPPPCPGRPDTDG
jgi:DNA-binding LacI/PurR family transcriptional regulator